ncbi:MAG: hypothetical protein WCG85_27415, partial [Polyangia bacterium]
MENLQPKGMPEVRASPSSLQVATKPLQSWANCGAERYSSALRPMDEVLRSSEMSTNRERCVPVSRQRLCEAIKHRPARAITKCLNACGGLEQIGEHDVLLSRESVTVMPSTPRPVVVGNPSIADAAAIQLRITMSSALN